MSTAITDLMHNFTQTRPALKACSYSHSFGLLVKAEKVRYMTYTLMTPGCSRPDVGCTAGTHRWIHDLLMSGYSDRDVGVNVFKICWEYSISTTSMQIHSQMGYVLVSTGPHIFVCMGRWPVGTQWGTGCHWCPERSCYINRPQGRCRIDPWRLQLQPQHWTASKSQRPKLRTTDDCTSPLNSCRDKEKSERKADSRKE